MTPSPWIAKFEDIAASVAKSKPLMLEEDKALTYGELFAKIHQCSALIGSLGLVADDRVILATRDNPSLLILFFSLLRNGITSVILDPGASKIESNLLAQTADARAIFADASFLERSRFEEILPDTVTYVTIAPDRTNRTGLLGRMLGRKKESDAVATFPAILASYRADHAIPAEVDENTVAYILFTSGTTSQPKGVEITHKNLFAQERTFARQYQFDEKVQLLNVLPMFHTDGLTHGPVLAFFVGATLHRPMKQFRVDLLPHLVRSIYTFEITHLITVPAVLALLKNLEAELSDVFSTGDFQFLISTAAFLDPYLWRHIEAQYRTRIVNVYGLTETVCEALYCGPDDGTRKIGTVGKPVDCEARIVNESGDDVPTGDVGELLLKGDHIMKGYFRRPKETAEVLKDGWLYTGDLARTDEQGFYDIVGRKKNVIITAGINVYPEDVTIVIRNMPGVVDAVTFGLPDETWGERVVSCVVTASETLTIEDIAAYCGENLSREKLPNKIFIFPELPRGPAGKVILQDVQDWVEREIREQDAIDSTGSLADQVELIAARVFKMTRDNVNANTSPDTAVNWNSLAHVEFLLELETHFGFEISPREIMLINNVGDATRLIEEKVAR